MSKFLGIDIGYGDVKVVVGTETEILHHFKFPSAVARAQKVSSIRDPRILDIRLPNGETDHVYVGQVALTLPSSDIIDIRDYALLEAYAPAFISKALEMVNESPDNFEVMVCGLSVAQLGMSGYFKERIKNFTVNGNTYSFKNVFLLPQGAGSKLAFDRYGEHFPEMRTSNPIQTFVGVDIGFNTLDMFFVTEGKTSPNLFEGIENAGVTRIAQKVQEEIKSLHGKEVAIHEAKEILDSGFYRLRGSRYDMNEVIAKVTQDYQSEILALIEDRYGKILDKCDFVCILGGGAEILKPTDPFFRVVKNKSEFYNAIGFYLFGVKQLA